MSPSIRDPMIRRFLLGSLLAGVFVWIVIRYFGASAQQMFQFLLTSFVLIFLLMGLAFLVSFCFRKFRDLLKTPDLVEREVGGEVQVKGEPDQSREEN